MYNAQVFSEDMITLKQARSLFKHGRSMPHMQTIRVWYKRGLFNRYSQRTVSLDYAVDGGVIYTSIQAVERFRASLNEKHPRLSNGYQPQ